MKKLAIAVLALLSLSSEAQAAQFITFEITGTSNVFVDYYNGRLPSTQALTASITIDTNALAPDAGAGFLTSLNYNSSSLFVDTDPSETGFPFESILVGLTFPTIDIAANSFLIDATSTVGGIVKTRHSLGHGIIGPVNYASLTSFVVKGSNIAPGGPINSIQISTVNTPTGGMAVPEPASWGLMLVGFGLIGLHFRRAEGRPARSTRRRAIALDVR